MKYSIGAVFGKLTITGFAERRKTCRYVFCKCDCGNPKEFEVFTGNIGKGHTTSCGCVQQANITTHGRSGTRAYKIYHHMVQRCHNPNKDIYPEYGGRGITVCDRWLESFENFLEDMGEPPKGYSLDRKDNNFGYSKDNCRWASLGTQVFNQKLRSDNTSGKTGVRLVEGDLWESRISFEKKIIIQGYFNTYEEAVSAREAAELKYYGEIKNKGTPAYVR